MTAWILIHLALASLPPLVAGLWTFLTKET
jgi:hypothetical protein